MKKLIVLTLLTIPLFCFGASTKTSTLVCNNDKKIKYSITIERNGNNSKIVFFANNGKNFLEIPISELELGIACYPNIHFNHVEYFALSELLNNENEEYDIIFRRIVSTSEILATTKELFVHLESKEQLAVAHGARSSHKKSIHATLELSDTCDIKKINYKERLIDENTLNNFFGPRYKDGITLNCHVIQTGPKELFEQRESNLVVNNEDRSTENKTPLFVDAKVLGGVVPK